MSEVVEKYIMGGTEPESILAFNKYMTVDQFLKFSEDFLNNAYWEELIETNFPNIIEVGYYNGVARVLFKDEENANNYYVGYMFKQVIAAETYVTIINDYPSSGGFSIVILKVDKDDVVVVVNNLTPEDLDLSLDFLISDFNVIKNLVKLYYNKVEVPIDYVKALLEYVDSVQNNSEDANILHHLMLDIVTEENYSVDFISSYKPLDQVKLGGKAYLDNLFQVETYTRDNFINMLRSGTRWIIKNRLNKY